MMEPGVPVRFDINDITSTIRMFNKLAESPQKAINKGTSKAALVLKRAIKSGVPERTGALKKNLVIRAEKSHKRGRKVRQVTVRGGPEANGIFQKDIANWGALGGDNKYAYYPSSMEYGFLARAPGGGLVYYDPKTAQFRMRPDSAGKTEKTQYIEGRHFMQEGADSSSESVKQTMINVTMEELEKIWLEKK